ncbi:CPBP family intramembrane metalloprotease [Asticcacaulis sp. EMRT-3]|uniref:CPBP family intramembrane glutamic endopeptidase n=1 Tax=Asticcacaulis sp. EMRT-3 TaxID=3040349 RepID=UPI0024AFA144|nr:CPBP family intramembrane metalloprotease [Asticcacaulis sp. EMRT-3]MDI7775049.1 CPBP family intramembrane metalloprotease [Asticcacaulis sp. EMRT-3]
MIDATTYLGLARRGKNAWWRYLLAWPLAIVMAMLIVPAVLLPLIMTHVITAGFVTEMQSPSHPVSFYLGYAALSFGAFLAGFILAIYIMHRKRFADIRGVWRWRDFLSGAGLWLALLILFGLIDYALRPHGFHLTWRSLTPAVVLVAVAGLAVQTFTEEFVFRGYLTQSLLLLSQRPLVAALLSGLAFGALHIPNGIPQAVFATVFGSVMSLVAIRTGGLAMSYGFHLVNNLFGSLVVVSMQDVFSGTPALITQNTPDLMGWDVITGCVAVSAAAWFLLRQKKV